MLLLSRAVFALVTFAERVQHGTDGEQLIIASRSTLLRVLEPTRKSGARLIDGAELVASLGETPLRRSLIPSVSSDLNV